MYLQFKYIFERIKTIENNFHEVYIINNEKKLKFPVFVYNLLY